MNITIKLYALLSGYLPKGAEKNAAPMDIGAGQTLGGVMSQLALPEAMCHLVLINGAYVAPGERATRELNDGDTVAIWPPVAGG
ncbi:MAG: MoaD/ThiS family protein [Rhodospirillales bacterium]